MMLLDHTPTFTEAQAAKIALEFYGLQATVKLLPSERDQNFHLVIASGEQFVLKVANALESPEFLEAQNLVMQHVEHEQVWFCPRVLPSSSNTEIREVESINGNTHFVRLITYLPGEPIGETNNYSPELLFDLGQKLGHLDRALSSFDHESLHRQFHWDIALGPQVIQEHGRLIQDQTLRDLVFSIREQTLEHMAPLQPRLRKSVIHGDANDYNVLVDDQNRISGIVDFGDMVHSFTIGELAIATAYVMLRIDDPVVATLTIAEGYRAEFSLLEEELDALWPLVLLRLCTSASLAAYQQQQRPDNNYLNISQQAIREKLPTLSALDWEAIATELKRQ